MLHDEANIRHTEQVTPRLAGGAPLGGSASPLEEWQVDMLVDALILDGSVWFERTTEDDTHYRLDAKTNQVDAYGNEAGWRLHTSRVFANAVPQDVAQRRILFGMGLL